MHGMTSRFPGAHHIRDRAAAVGRCRPLRGLRRSAAMPARRTLLGLAAYLALAALILWPAGLGGEILSACAPFVRNGPFPDALRRAATGGTPLLSDAMQQFEPWLRYAASAFERTGALPLWKDSHLCGAPLLGNAQSALLWPPNLLAIVLGAPGALLAWMAMAKFVLAGWGAWLLARHLGVSALGSFLSGAVFAFGGFQVLCLLHPHSNVSALLPWLLLCADRAALRPSGRRVAAVALVAGLQHLGGHPETAFHCQALAAALVLARAAAAGGGVARALASRALWLPLAGMALGVGLAAVQILPFLEYLRLSEVLAQRTATAATPIVPSSESLIVPLALVAALGCARRLASDDGRRVLPSALGLFVACSTLFVSARRDGLDYDPVLQLAPDWFGAHDGYRGFGNYALANSGYAGAALALAILGLLAGRPRGYARTAGVVLLVGALVGDGVPVVAGLFERLPLFDVSANARLQLYASLAVAVLAGLGWDALGTAAGAGSWRRRFVGATGAFVLAALLAFVVSIARGQAQTSEIAGALRRARPMEAAAIESAPATATGLVGGWVAPASPPKAAVLLFGRARSAPLALVPLSAAQVAQLPEEARASGAVYAFHSQVGDGLPAHTPYRILCVGDDGSTSISSWLGATGELPLWALRAAAPEGAKSDLELGAFAAAVLLVVAALGTAVGRPALRRLARVALVVLVLASLVLFASDFPPTVPPALFYPRSPLLDELARLRPDARSFVLGGFSLQWDPETAAAYDLREPTGYDAVGPLLSSRLVRAACGDENRPLATRSLSGRPDVDRRLLGIMAVRDLVHSTRRPVQGETIALFEPGQALTLNEEWLPRARVVPRAEVESDDERALARMRDPNFDAAGTVLLSEKPADAAADAAGEPAGAGGPVRFLLDEPDSVQVEVAGSGGGYLVLADTFFPGWRALVDGVERPIVRANLAFRAVPLRAGDAVVSFEYRPLSVRVGLAVSLASVLALALLARPRSSRGGAAPAVPAR
jgi:hypothetical protein